MPTFIDIGPRNRPVNSYSEQTGPIGAQSKDNQLPKNPADQKKKVAKGWKTIIGGGFDHQFFNNQKLDELEKKEIEWLKYELD